LRSHLSPKTLDAVSNYDWLAILIGSAYCEYFHAANAFCCKGFAKSDVLRVNVILTYFLGYNDDDLLAILISISF
jgi:hypothetical protein